MTTVLVIEDTPSLREEILEMLDVMNFRSIEAENGSVGVQMAQNYLPDVILCDVMMPEMNGFDVLQTLRRDPETAQIPFIFLTAKSDRADIRRGMNLGADDYLVKPFTSDDLAETITARLYKQAVVTFPHVREMKRAAAHLGQMAFRDILTGLPNRILFRQNLQEALTQAKRNQSKFAVFYISLEHFRNLNMRFGQAVGDAILQTFAQRLVRCVRSQDTVARLSGDEFGILANLNPDPMAPDGAIQVAEKILSTLSTSYTIEDHSIQLQVSMGGSVYPDDNGSVEQLINHAVIAMNWGRKWGNLACQFYSDEIAEATTIRNRLEVLLRGALDRSEMEVHYQPQVNLVTGRIIGAEALLRWNNHEIGVVSPATFMPIAEETGLIVPIGEWLIQEACRQAKIWQSSHYLPIQLSINLSAYQFKQAGWVRSLAQTLEKMQLSPELLSIELSEATLMEDVTASLNLLQQISAMKVQIGIDDFGTGHSSLNHLIRFPINTLKIDNTFVQNLTLDKNDAAIASAITGLAKNLNLRVVAEGVETQEQLRILRHQGCHAIQGFLFSPAVPVEQFEEFLATDKRLSLL